MQGINIKQVARLARLHLESHELTTLELQVDDILGFIEKLKEVSVENVEPTCHPLAVSNVFRSDIVSPKADIEQFLKKSPDTKGRFFQVPKVIEDKL